MAETQQSASGRPSKTEVVGIHGIGEQRPLGTIREFVETVYSRELAPLAGHYPALKLGPSWWFHASPEGMLRFREYTGIGEALMAARDRYASGLRDRS